MAHQSIYLEGQRFERLTVLSFSHRDKKGMSYWNCSCACGRMVTVRGGHLTDGGTHSCGCLKQEQRRARGTHRMIKTRTYSSWTAMKRRCINPDCTEFPSYGGRGISVCERWMEFSNFYADMGERPNGKSIDRIDNNGNYEPGNCRWATPTEQQNNRRCNRLLTFDGVTKTLEQWGRHFNINPSTVSRRLARGYYVESSKDSSGETG